MKLIPTQRNRLPAQSFAEPKARAYPINDASHARNALSRVAQNGSPAEKAKIRAKVHRKFPDIGKLDKGSPRVPGKPPADGHDTVKATLSPGEAVLTKGAAQAIGRPRIAAANAAHPPRTAMAKTPRKHFDEGSPEVPLRSASQEAMKRAAARAEARRKERYGAMAGDVSPAPQDTPPPKTTGENGYACGTSGVETSMHALADKLHPRRGR